MRNTLILGMLCTLSLSAFAQKDCTLNVNTRTFMELLSNEEVLDIASQLAAPTNIQIVDGQSDYSLEVYATVSMDHHDARYAYAHGNTQVWPSNQIKDRSSVEAEFSTGFVKRKKITKASLTKLLTTALKGQMESCANLDRIIKSTGNGTLSPVEGSKYVTTVGATFERVGSYWKDPSGLLWGEILAGEYANASTDSPAVKACEAEGARLPTAEEYKNLLTYFSPSTDRNHALSNEGKFEFNALFPWSFGMYTTATRDASGVGHDFHHVAGVSSAAMAHWELNVRCVK